MINPVDTNGMKALSESRQQDLVHLSRKREAFEEWHRSDRSTQSRVNPVRRSVGIRLMRAGARLAGICIQPEMSRQP